MEPHEPQPDKPVLTTQFTYPGEMEGRVDLGD